MSLSATPLSLSMSQHPSLFSEILMTLVASVRSVGTACTLASVGIYLHQKGFVVGQGKRTLALISQQVTIPLLFFTKILYCNQDWSTEKCPNVTDSLKDVWILLLWPLYVCGMGISVGYVCAIITKVPSHQRSAILVAVGFGNTTGLPITLLQVIHSNFPSNTDMGRIDPTLFLSVYLLLYPVLQWGIGGWLLAAEEKEEDTTRKKKKKKKRKIDHHPSSSSPTTTDAASSTLVQVLRCRGQQAVESLEHSTLAHNVLNHRTTSKYRLDHRGLDNLDASLYMSVQEHLDRYGQPVMYNNNNNNNNNTTEEELEQEDTWKNMSSTPPTIGMTLSEHNSPIPPIDRNMTITTTPVSSTPPGTTMFSLRHVESNASIGMDLSNNTASGGDLETASHFKTVIHTTATDAKPKATSAFVSSFYNPFATSSTKISTGTLHTLVEDEKTANFQHNSSGANGGYGKRNNDYDAIPPVGETTHLLSMDPNNNINNNNINKKDDNCSQSSSSSTTTATDSYQDERLWDTFLKVAQRCFQPPVIGALLGLFVASFESLRGIFVDVVDRTGDAPLEWFFDGLYAVGQAAVPINMIILGCNLSASYMLNDKDHQDKFFTKQASMAVVIGKMIVLPVIGYVSVYLLQFVYPISNEIAGSFYLVMLVVFLCPTANNVMVMVELSGNGSKEGMARIISYQYMVAPVILSLTVTVSVLMATTISNDDNNHAGSMMTAATVTAAAAATTTNGTTR
ncbi:auxin efflux carrier [Nitzschia inconspicua]|uniref:Auxin efflux carrier n=1 Tax=Nitzschia inconspicua TaxID=303405 RepID=A0A9K3Q739_9STRA|nr:auxin efflux carrier [Nitzschia inconspicua]